MKTIFRNYNILKFCFAALTSYLLYQEFYVFLVEKPTYTSSAKLKIGLNGTLHQPPVNFRISPSLTVNFPTSNVYLLIDSGPDHYPDITLCPFPSYNHAKLRSYGYYNSFDYAKVCTVYWLSSSSHYNYI